MPFPHIRIRPWLAMVRRRIRTANGALMLGVLVWWLLVAGVITVIVTVSGRLETADASSFRAGQEAHLTGGRLGAWLIAIERTTYDDYHGRVLAGREATVTDDRILQGWIGVVEGQAVRITVVGGGAVEVELLEGPNTGARGWLDTQYLRP